METIIVMLESIGLVVGGLVVALLLCWLLWQLFRPLHHPEWATFAIACLIGVGLTGNLPRSELINMALAFLAPAVIPLWIEGRAWRKRWRAHQGVRDSGLWGWR